MNERVLHELMTAVPPPRTDAQRRAQAAAAAAFEPPRDGGEPTTGLRKCSFDLPQELAREFKLLCTIQGVKQRRVVERLLAAYVEQHRARLPREEAA
ncbi:MAG: hypothetical protein M9894_30625 [Planctomycetes bacterium]|nr:hypothetical protein [Planctomycetota bacterium]